MGSTITDWRAMLADYLDREERSEHETSSRQEVATNLRREFLERAVLPAFRALGRELQLRGRHVEISAGEWRADFTVRHHGRTEFHAAVKLEGSKALLVLFEKENGHPLPVESSFAVGMSRPQDVTEEEVLLALVSSYTHGGTSRGPDPQVAH